MATEILAGEQFRERASVVVFNRLGEVLLHRPSALRNKWDLPTFNLPAGDPTIILPQNLRARTGLDIIVGPLFHVDNVKPSGSATSDYLAVLKGQNGGLTHFNKGYRWLNYQLLGEFELSDSARRKIQIAQSVCMPQEIQGHLAI